MNYIDGFCLAVSEENKEEYIDFARQMTYVFKEHGALRTIECWEDDVPDGELTSFPMAVKREAGEAVLFSWIVWPDKEARTKGWEGVNADPRLEGAKMPFDGKRMIYGGFQMVFDSGVLNE